MACSSHDCGDVGGRCGGACSCDSPLPERKIEGGSGGPSLCVKCKERTAALTVGNQSEPICADCLHASLLAKFRTAVNNNGLVVSSDKVLVAFSGGPASRAALELLTEIRSKAQSNAGAAKDRGLSVFGLGAVFVDERTVLQLAPADAEGGVNEIRSMFVDGAEDGIPLHVVPTECVFDNNHTNYRRPSDNSVSSESNVEKEAVDDAGQKLSKLFQGINDATGKEDLLEYLRMQAVQKVAQEEGYTKVVLGLCTTRIAARVIAATTKGRGYSLPADIQYLDARWPVPVALPLRDCVARELALFCHLSKFKTVFIQGLTTMAAPQTSLNNLAHSFVTVLQEENSSREYAIVRTTAKLKSFSFNVVLQPPNRRRRNPQALRGDTSSQSNSDLNADILCPICCAPVSRKDLVDAQRNKNPADKAGIYRNSKIEVNGISFDEFSEFKSTSCPSCCFQIFPENGKNTYELYGLLPNSMKERGTANYATQQKWMRSQIESYLLPEGEDSED
ncbi:unnamed protein product [Calypogeia fissa]